MSFTQTIQSKLFKDCFIAKLRVLGGQFKAENVSPVPSLLEPKSCSISTGQGDVDQTDRFLHQRGESQSSSTIRSAIKLGNYRDLGGVWCGDCVIRGDGKQSI